ncbi:MAG: ribosomal L7Ae/L30e/S12e/Gadd45 family protein [Sporolactobacillus sp.]|jgi:ribosomal protein L7Ae-like RNA K-turn-binding protein|nr:ribosomal L7Ae/L30e/S12e/Gadd45 family protein [Sporolactobacillus sp.]MCI1883017.1 ribosomal L7Ae/L30e/S12e/Gadd45 family protein [Sporolactobacillus sp.]
MPRSPEGWQALLGLARRAGKAVSGEDTVIHYIKSRKAKAVIISTDASDRTKKTVGDKCGFYHVPLLIAPSREQIGAALGQPPRVLAAVTDNGFAGGLIKQLETFTRG